MSRSVSTLSARGKDSGMRPFDRAPEHMQGYGDEQYDAALYLADLVGRDTGDLSIDRLVPEGSPVVEILRSRPFDDIDIRRISELL